MSGGIHHVEYYALWVTRNGQHTWSGPHRSDLAAMAELDKLMYCSGQRIAVVMVRDPRLPLLTRESRNEGGDGDGA